MPSSSRRAAVLAALALVLPLAGHAQASFPEKSIELVVPFVAGTAPDAVARGLAEGMTKQLGQPVVVTNKPGAGGAIGYRYVQALKPDGYVLILNSNSVSTGFHGGLMPFDYKAFDSLARVTVEFPVIAVRADAPFANLKDMVAYTRQNPGKLRVGSTSIGSHMHLTSLSFFADQKGEVTHVPFATSGHVTSLLGGHIDAVVTLPGSVAGQVKAGQLKVLGVLASQREPVFGGVPTAKEQGIAFESDLWRGVAAPKGLPPAVALKLEDAIRKTVTGAEFKQLGDKVGFLPAFLPAEPFARTIASEDSEIAGLMKKNGIQIK
jgi:tripartite-type tricarboxylate transporter receptor subunit TctC